MERGACASVCVCAMCMYVSAYEIERECVGAQIPELDCMSLCAYVRMRVCVSFCAERERWGRGERKGGEGCEGKHAS